MPELKEDIINTPFPLNIDKTKNAPKLAEVALDVPLDKTFHYSIPDNLKSEINIGKRVQVPFGNRNIVGIVTGFAEESNIKNIKEITKLYNSFPMNPKLIKLAKWISSYYASFIGTSLMLTIPSGLKKDKAEKYHIEPEEKDLSPVEDSKIQLNKEQKKAFEEISKKINSFNIFLLHGVTASGKTEIYLKATEKVIESGKAVIVLVPEIALTAQTLERFKERFKNEVAIIHSRLSEKKRLGEWIRCFEGNAKIVIGARSALFAPFPEVGLIIVDEEHEPSYKEMTSPKYNARDAAIKRAELENCPVILGSATPSLESYYKALNGEYILLELKERVEKRSLPDVKIVDMADEFQFKRESIFFSRSLLKELKKVLENKEQAMLFINRRGFSTFISCKSCGYVIKCKRCDSIMVYHASKGDLVCHYCNHSDKLPKKCPKCAHPQFKFFGIGTEKVESEINRLFPRARVARLDTDATKKRGSHEKVFLSFRKHDIDILVGTQMIAKGLDFPNVTLIGVISSDITLNLSDFRASERTFNLLTQVAGRSGRGHKKGLVIVQTYNPKHYSIILSSKHDYMNFYEAELKFREELDLPPLTNLIKITLSASKDEIAKNATEKLKNIIIQKLNLKDGRFLGSAPAVIKRIKNKYLWNLFLKTKDVIKTSKTLKEILNNSKVFEKAYISIDVDPV